MKQALVTGASKGIGASIAKALTAKGFCVVGTSRAGGTLSALDVTDAASVTRCVASLDQLDLLVNNAGVMLRGALEETSDDQAHAVFETNFFGVARITRAALPLLRASRGRVINIGSIAGGNAPPFIGHYAATKHALVGYTEALRIEQKPFGVDVCLVEPSDFRSDLFAQPMTAQPMTEYDALRETVAPFFDAVLARAEDPDIVGALVAEIACARTTRLRNRVGKWGRLLPHIKAILPQRAFERFMEKGLKIGKLSRHAPPKRIERV